MTVDSTLSVVPGPLNAIPEKHLQENSKGALALLIQAVWRSVAAKKELEEEKKMHFLPSSLMLKAKVLLEKPAELMKLPRASDGRIPVLMPPGLPLVIKVDEAGFLRNRFRGARLARSLCHRKAFNHLVIPRMRQQERYLVEEKLEGVYGYIKEHIGQYIAHRDSFTPAIVEFTQFLFLSDLKDIVGDKRLVFWHMTKAPLGRYDNVLLYLHEGRGLIGLADLEDYAYETDSGDIKKCVSKCKTALILFPHHYDAILSVALQFNPHVQHYENALRKTQTDTLTILKKVYEDHREFLKRKQISVSDPYAFPFRSDGVNNRILTEVILELKIKYPRIVEVFKGNYKKILQIIFETLQGYIAALLNKTSGITEIDLVAARTFEFKNGSKSFAQFHTKIAEFLDSDIIAAEIVLDLILMHLYDLDQVAYYNSDLGSHSVLFC